jgi:predicted regulator of Ras-like GTPase activity (Roadblock/LC7/MglB family)
VPYRVILERLLERVPGSLAALLLDAQGEVVIGAGQVDERHRLIGAYQGIALGAAERAAERFDAGTVRSLAWRHDGGTVVIEPLRDGYYLLLSLGQRAIVGLAQRRCEEARARLEVEI